MTHMRPLLFAPVLAFILLSPCLNLRAQDGSILSAAIDHGWRTASTRIFSTPSVPAHDTLPITRIDEGLVLAFERVWAKPGRFYWSPKIAAGMYRNFASGRPLGADLAILRGDLGPMFRYALHADREGPRFYAGFAATGWLAIDLGEKKTFQSRRLASSVGFTGDLGIEYLSRRFLYFLGVNGGFAPVGVGSERTRLGIGKSF